MNSIQQQQPENNHKDLHGQEAVAQIKETVKKTSSCFFSTAAVSPGSNTARPMSVQEVDDAGNLWFLSAIDSHKNEDLETDSSVTLYFQGSSHSDFLLLHGHATITRDPAKINELWEPIIKAWFTEGKNDPRISVIKVAPHSGYYWDTKHGNMVAGVKILLGALTGKTLDDSIEGKLTFS